MKTLRPWQQRHKFLRDALAKELDIFAVPDAIKKEAAARLAIVAVRTLNHFDRLARIGMLPPAKPRTSHRLANLDAIQARRPKDVADAQKLHDRLMLEYRDGNNKRSD